MMWHAAYHGLFVAFHVILLTHVLAAPNKRRDKGPCVGMDCLHGVLMHGDKQMGDGHQQEDTFNRLKQKDIARHHKRPPGPCQGEDCMESIQHGEIDPDKAHQMTQKIGPDQKKDRVITAEIEEVLHGGSIDHNEPRKLENRKENKEPPDIANMDALLHGGKHVDHNAPRKSDNTKHNGEPSTVDMDTVLHGGDHVDHNAPRKIDDSKHKGEPSTVDMDKVLHGGDHVDHNAPRKNPEVKGDQQPSTVDIHDALHGGVHVDHSKEPTKVPRRERPVIHDPESLLHGSGDGDIHTKQKENVKRNTKAVGTLDPHALIHGEYKIGAGGAEEKDLKDYKDWQKQQAEQTNEDEQNDEDDPIIGYSFPFISDTILNEIEILKRRYMPKFWATGDGTSVSDDNTEDGKLEPQKDTHVPREQEDGSQNKRTNNNELK